MIASALRKRSASVEPDNHDSRRKFPTMTTSAERTARLIIAARAKLEPLMSEKLTYKQANKIYAKIGDLDGVGLLLKLVSFDVDADGSSVSDDVLREFQREGALMVDSVTSSLLNFSVLFSLFLTIFVSLQVLHLGGEPYAQATSSLKLGTTSRTAAAGDAAAFLWSQDAERQETFRWVCYAVECVFLSLGTLMCGIGLMSTMQRYMMICNLPSVAAQIEHMMGRLQTHSLVGFMMFMSILILIVAVLPMMLVRASAVAFLCASVSGLLFLVLAVRMAFGGEEMWCQIAEVRLVLTPLYKTRER